MRVTPQEFEEMSVLVEKLTTRNVELQEAVEVLRATSLKTIDALIAANEGSPGWRLKVFKTIGEAVVDIRMSLDKQGGGDG